MSPVLHHECLRVPVTALATVGPLLLAAEGPFVRFYHRQDSKHFIFLGSKKIFRDESIHGIAVYTESSPDVILAVWGGPLVRFIHIKSAPWINNLETQTPILESLKLSPVARAPDWIFDLSFGPAGAQKSHQDDLFCAAVTGHNALVRLTMRGFNNAQEGVQYMSVDVSELSSSSRSILYSAHLLWDSPEHILVAAGTAFGEIILWSWRNEASTGPETCVHRVFLGHEGSIFGVRISKEFKGPSGQNQKLLASCSDDRTIRLWDISGISTSINNEQSDAARTRHTGFATASLDVDSSNSDCVAIGWGHMSRVWAIQFLDSQLADLSISLLSSGEDATSRVWRFTPKNDESLPLELAQIGNAAYHDGKNIWSTAVFEPISEPLQVVCGGADSRISAYMLAPPSQASQGNNSGGISEYTIQDLFEMGEPNTDSPKSDKNAVAYKSSKTADFFRSYAFIDSTSFLLTTNSGRIFLETLSPAAATITNSKLIGQLDELSGYSICAADSSLGVGFVAGSRGSIYMFQQKDSPKLSKIHTIAGKVGSMFIAPASTGQNPGTIVLLATLMGRQTAQLLYIDANEFTVTKTTELLLPESSTGLAITSMAYVPSDTDTDSDFVFLGFRAGSVAAYTVLKSVSASKETRGIHPCMIERMHGKEAVTSMMWYPMDSNPTAGYLVSVGRDGCCAIHCVDFSVNTISLRHNLPLAIGTNLEGLYDHHGNLVVYGFSSTRFVVYDITSEEEIMSVEVGGSHRSWSFQPHTSKEGGGTLVWTRASNMHCFSHTGPNHSVIRSGGHGREIKDVAISHSIGGNSSRKLIATGAEDTDIKIFEYVDGDFVCRRTLRKHNTGIQHLKWSEDGDYLFSSGGGEEFCVWRVRTLPSFIGIGVIYESVCAPDSEHSDLRITSFDVRKRGDGDERYIISMVFSDSNTRVSSYSPTAAMKWQTLAQGVYFTSCLTQSVFLSDYTLLTTGTDGHAVLWFLPTNLYNQNGGGYSPVTLKWDHPARIHQNTSKTLDTLTLPNNSKLLVSGGDDGSLAFVLPSPTATSISTHSPVVLVRAHISAITACAILSHKDRIFVLTSGNDQWIRLWEVVFNIDVTAASSATEGVATEGLATGKEMQDFVTIKRARKLQTNVADVSSMAVLEESDTATKVVVCGVGMEVLRVHWNSV